MTGESYAITTSSRSGGKGVLVTDSYLDASRKENERLREDARENYARAEQAEQALMPLRSQVTRLRAVADNLAVALHQCAAFLPLFLSEHGEEGRKLQRALDVNVQVDAAMATYCVVTETRRQALNGRTVTRSTE